MSSTRRQFMAGVATALAMANAELVDAQTESPAVATPQSSASITEAEAQAAIDRYIEALTAVNPTAIASQFTKGGTFQDTQLKSPPEFTGQDDIVYYWHGLVEGFDQMAFDVISCQLVLDPDDPSRANVVIVWRLKAHHGGKKNSIAGTPTGREIRINGGEWLTLFKGKNGRIEVERDSSFYNGPQFVAQDEGKK